MTPRRKRHAALCVFLVTTAPALGLLCRGHSPSRFMAANLPPWERVLPHPAPARVALRSSPLLLDAYPVHRLDGRAEVGLMDVPPNDAARPGQWLLAACPLGRHDAALSARQDAVALRLMEAQRGDGDLAGGVGAGRWSRAQMTVHARNLCGLLAYYAVSHSPAAVQAALQAGDLVLERFPDVETDAGRTQSLVAPVTLLYQATGDTRYRRWAEARAQAGITDGAGLCALYVATGERHYLRGAQRVWRQECIRHKTDQDLAASLWNLTGAPVYAKVLRPSVASERYPAAGRPRPAT